MEPSPHAARSPLRAVPFAHRASRLAPYLALLLAWFLFFWRFAAPAQDRVTYPAGDFTETFGLFHDIAYRSLLAGRLSLWADCLNSGYPLHADPQAQLFYPPLWLTFAFLRLFGWGHFPIEALVAEVAFHYLFLSLFLYLFLGSLRLRSSAAVLGALVFTYGGYLTGSPPLQTGTLATDTWLPLALLFAGRLAHTHRPRDVALTALMLALAFLAGHPQTFVYVALLTLAYYLFRAQQHIASQASRSAPRSRRRAFILLPLAFIVLTAVLSALQLIPTLHFILNSTRASVSFAQAGHGFPFEDVLQFFLTGFVSRWHPLYVGILPLALAALALARPNAETRFWAGAALVGLVLSFGAKAAAYDPAYWLVPGWRLFRGQEHLALVVSFSLAVLAAHGAHRLFAPLSRLGRRQLARLQHFGLYFWGTTIGLLALSTYLARLGFDPSDWRKLPDRVGVLTLGAGLALLVVVLRARAPSVRRYLPALAAAVVVLDLFAANRPLNVVPAFEPYPYLPLLDPITADAGFFRVQDDYQLAGHAGCAYGYRAADGRTPYQIADYARFVERAPEAVRWRLLGVKYLVTWQQTLAAPGLASEEVASAPALPDAPNDAGITKVFRLNYGVRRAFLVSNIVVAPDDDSVYAALAAPGFDPFTTVVLSRPFTPSPNPPTTQPPPPTLLLDSPGHLRLQARSESDSVLVISEPYFPGWRAWVDGRPAPLLRADGALQALAVPAGEHLVELVYQPPALLWGIVTSVAAGLLTLALLAWGRIFDHDRHGQRTAASASQSPKP